MNTVEVVLLLFSVFFASSIFRRQFQGPLPPGPRGLPFVGSVLQMPTSYMWLTFASWAERWGDLVSFKLLGQRYVVISSAAHAIDMLDKKSAIYSSRAPIPVAGDMIGWKNALILQPYGHRMREYRKLFGLVMATPKRVEQYHHIIEDETKKFLIGLSDRTDHLVEEVKRLTGAMIVLITYGYKSTGVGDLIISTVDKAMEEFAIVTAPGAFLADIFPTLRYVPEWFPGTTWKKVVAEQRDTLDQMIELPYRWLKQQMAEGTAHPSFASALFENNTDKEREELIKYVAASIYAGGADTTVSSMTTFFLAMTLHPEIQAKAQAEIDAVVGKDRMPSIADKERLPYVHAVMLEVLRWLPVTPMGFFHRLSEDDVHAGYYFPKGTLFAVNVWKLLHDPSIYADPMTFNPERFIATSGKPAERDPRDFAFGFGRRRCPGVHFAEASNFAVIVQTLWVYNIQKATDEKGNVIEPEVKPSGSLISHPEPWKFKMSIRSDKAQALLDEFEASHSD